MTSWIGHQKAHVYIDVQAFYEPGTPTPPRLQEFIDELNGVRTESAGLTVRELAFGISNEESGNIDFKTFRWKDK